MNRREAVEIKFALNSTRAKRLWVIPRNDAEAAGLELLSIAKYGASADADRRQFIRAPFAIEAHFKEKRCSMRKHGSLLRFDFADGSSLLFLMAGFNYDFDLGSSDPAAPFTWADEYMGENIENTAAIVAANKRKRA